MKGQKRLFIVDISSFIFRAFFAIRPLHSLDGTPVNAVYGVMKMILKLLSEHNPSHFVMARDLSGPSFRHEIYKDYKGNRSAPPEDLIPQFDLIDKLLDLMAIPSISMEKYEADDIIGSLAVQYENDFDEIVIASGDKDLMQFVGSKTSMLDTMKNKKYDKEAVFEKMGVWPEQIVDYLSIVGDSSDNIPGIKGIGAKGAAKLLEQYENLDSIFKNKEKLTNKRVVKGIYEYGDMGLLSRKLVSIVTDLKLPFTSDELSYRFTPSQGLLKFLESLKFSSIIRDLQNLSQIEPKKQLRKVQFSLLEDLSALERFLESESTMSIFPVFKEGFLTALYLANERGKYGKYLQIEKGVSRVLNSSGVLFLGENIQSFMRSLLLNGEEVQFDFMDVGLMDFELGENLDHALENLAARHLDKVISRPIINNEGLLKEGEADHYESDIADYLDIIFPLCKKLELEIREFGVEKLWRDLDRPLVRVLAKMEATGVWLDKDLLHGLGERFSEELEKIEERIIHFSQGEVNLRSPKQVGELLFETLKFPVIKKTKTGYSTGIEVLKTLEKKHDHEVPSLLIKYRELDKLMSTYIKSLPNEVNLKTGRVHTHYRITGTSTGRLSSDKPNLQNIPIKTENGRLVRKAFKARDGHVFVGGDYSQVELRILAHFCEDPTMLKAFRDGLDIHSQTASEIFNIPLGEMTPKVRSQAKAINFGLIYGQSSFGLSQTLGISRKEAKTYIDFYFERFGKVRDFLHSLKEKCQKFGYAETLWGRRRLTPDIKSSNFQMRSMAERVAINTPIQGTAADIIKKSMISLDKRLERENLKSKLILQVHDELILEVPENEVGLAKKILVEEMMGAFELKVPLKVDISESQNWYEL